jgi:DNA-binding winged helix-turn-helix (wHTH) protein
MLSKKPPDTEPPPIVIELLALKKAGLPVLLYGRDDCGRVDLIRIVHLLSGGIDGSWQYQGCDENIKTNDDLESEIRKANNNQDYEKLKKLFLDCKDTIKTFKHVDCNFQSGKDVYDELSRFEYRWSDDTGIISSNLDVSPMDESQEVQFINEMYMESDTKELIWRKGLLFLDNLVCEDRHDKDYMDLAKNVEKRRFCDAGHGNWLVAYAYKYENFPRYFLDQFELVSLEREGDEEKEQENLESIEIDSARKLIKYKGKNAKLEPKQIELFELMWENKDKVVKRKEIDKALWSETDDGDTVSPMQIDQQINKLREGLEKLGFKKVIIETYKKTQLNEGGYEFHSDLTSFLEEP